MIPEIAPVTPPQKNVSIPNSPSKTSLTYEASVGNDISDDLVRSCADLFSTNYGVWGDSALTISKFTKPGRQTIYSQHLSLTTFLSFRAARQNEWQKTARAVHFRSGQDSSRNMFSG